MKGRSLECDAFQNDVPVYLRLGCLRVAYLTRGTASSPRAQPITFKVETTFHTPTSLGEMQRIAFRLLLSSHVCVYVCLSVCVFVCVCVYMPLDLRKTVWDRDVVFLLRGMTPDITCKRFTQIWLQIPRWRTKWWPWNTIIGRNSVIY